MRCILKNICIIWLKALLTAIVLLVVTCFIPDPWEYPDETKWVSENGDNYIGSDIFHFDIVQHGDNASVKYKGTADIVLLSGDGLIHLNNGDVLNCIKNPVGFTVLGEKGDWRGLGTFEVLKEDNKKSYHFLVHDDRAIYF